MVYSYSVVVSGEKSLAADTGTERISAKPSLTTRPGVEEPQKAEAEGLEKGETSNYKPFAGKISLAKLKLSLFPSTAALRYDCFPGQSATGARVRNICSSSMNPSGRFKKQAWQGEGA